MLEGKTGAYLRSDGRKVPVTVGRPFDDRSTEPPRGLWMRSPGSVIATSEALVTNVGRLVLGYIEADVVQ